MKLSLSSLVAPTLVLTAAGCAIQPSDDQQPSESLSQDEVIHAATPVSEKLNRAGHQTLRTLAPRNFTGRRDNAPEFAHHRRGNSPHHHHHHSAGCHHQHGGDGGTGGSNAVTCPLDISEGALSGECTTLQGSFFSWSDGDDKGTSTIEPQEFGSGVNDEACVSGTASQILDDAYDIYYGSALFAYLARTDDDGNVIRYDAEEEAVVGVRFQIVGAPAEVRFEAVAPDPDTGMSETYCNLVNLQEGSNEVLFQDLMKNCWDGTGQPIDTSQMENIQWHVLTNSNSAVDFSFCVSSIELVH